VMNPSILKLVETCIMITHHLSCAWSPVMRSSIHPENLEALVEVRDVRDLAPGELSVLHKFLFKNQEHCFILLGNLCPALRSNFYGIDNIKGILIDNILLKIDIIALTQIKLLMRQFLCPFIKSCPADYLQSVALPILSDFCRYMVQRLHPEWESFARVQKERNEGGSPDGEDEVDEEKIEEEMFRDKHLRAISREYLDFLLTLSVNKTPPRSKPNEVKKSDDPADGLPVAQLTQLGTVIAPTVAGEQIWNTTLLALSWHDGQTCSKASALLGPTLKLFFKTSQLKTMPAESVRTLFEGILRGLNRHGTSNQGQQALFPLAMAVTTFFGRTHQNTLVETMTSAIPQSEKDVQNYFNTYYRTNIKKRKVLFKKLVSPIIEHHVSQRFREIPDMNRYSSINLLRGPKVSAAVDEEAVVGLAGLFQPEA